MLMSCYTLLAVYLSQAGNLEATNLEEMYTSLQKYGYTNAIVYGKSVMYKFEVTDQKREGYEECHVGDKTYYGKFNYLN